MKTRVKTRVEMIDILLPSGLHEEIDWRIEEAIAQKAKELGEKILWKFDFGLHLSSISLDDSSHFLSFSLALEQFSKTFAKTFEAETEGVVLYDGDICFHERMLWSGPLQDYFQEWLKEIKAEDSLHYKRLFCMHLFAEYLHRLSSYLPEEIVPYCFFENTTESAAVCAQLFSKERFGPIRLQKKEIAAATGVVLPRDEVCSLPVLEKLDHLLQELTDQKMAFKMIPEPLLTEEWQGIERLIVLEGTSSSTGERMLRGFEASGGILEIR